MQEGTAMLEDYVELLSQAAVKVSSALISGTTQGDSSNPRSALGVLWKLQMNLSGDALLKFQVGDLSIEQLKATIS
jgi:hypothetical protein